MRADLRGGGGARDFRGLFFSASNTRIRRFFSFLTSFWGCVLYASASYMRKYTVLWLNTCYLFQARKIHRISFNGTDLETLVWHNLPGAEGIAIDWIGRSGN